jgi:hypothetical protein
METSDYRGKRKTTIGRMGLTGALAAVMMLLLAACGTGSTTGSATGSDNALSATATTAAPQATITLADITTATAEPEATATVADDMGDMGDMTEVVPTATEDTSSITTDALPTAESTATAAPDAGAQAGASTEVQATLREWAIDLSTQEVAAGKITIVVTNAGQFAHNLTVTDSSGTLAKTPNFRSTAGTQTLEVELQPGTYTLICDLPGHAARGQSIELVVK